MDSLVIVITLGILMLTAICTLPSKGDTYVSKITFKIPHILFLELEKKEKRSDVARKSHLNVKH